MTTAASVPELDRPFADQLLAIHVSHEKPGFPFAHFAAFICRRTGGTVVERLGAPAIDEVYWDIRVGDVLLVLHYQHFLGVFLCAGSPEAEKLVEELLPDTQRYVTGWSGWWGRIRWCWHYLASIVKSSPAGAP